MVASEPKAIPKSLFLGLKVKRRGQCYFVNICFPEGLTQKQDLLSRLEKAVQETSTTYTPARGG